MTAPSAPAPVAAPVAKAWWRSITVWTNVATVVAVALGGVADNALALGIPPAAAVWVLLALGVVNTAIRVLRTSQPLSVGGAVPSLRAAEPESRARA